MYTKYNKYARDYRLIETFEADGRIKTSCEYIGKYYYFDLPLRKRRGAGRLCLLSITAIWVMWVCAMIFPSDAMRHFPVSIMHVFLAVPLSVLANTVVLAAGKKDRLQRRQRDRVANGYSPRCILMGVLSALDLLIESVRLFISYSSLSRGESVFLVCSVIICVLSMFLFHMRLWFSLHS